MTTKSFAVVAIGRNEGQRLERCLNSIASEASLIVYVDSGSTDGSVELAKQKGCEVVQLDMATPFTAARARNAGFRQLLKLQPDLTFVFFVDGDCEIEPDWLTKALLFLNLNPEVAAVCGRRREKFPESSVYNLMCDFEWDRVPGPVRLFGGDVMMRIMALMQVKGYRDELIAGEEPELGVRMRALGWKLHRLPDAMTLHDANILRFSQWWKRAKRAGYAYTEGAVIHGKLPERHCVWQTCRIALWGGMLPFAILLLSLINNWWVLLILIYPTHIIRIAMVGKYSPQLNLIIAFFLVIGRFAEFSGQLSFIFNRIASRRGKLIEYK